MRAEKVEVGEWPELGLEDDEEAEGGKMEEI